VISAFAADTWSRSPTADGAKPPKTTFVLTPSSAIPVDTLEDARAFARDLISPLQASVLTEMAQPR
jgi:hypothetical protein